MVGCRSSRLNQNKPLSGPVSTLMSSSAEFYSFSLSGRLRAIRVHTVTGKIDYIPWSTNDAMWFLCLVLNSVSVSPMYVSEVLLSFRVTVAW